MILLDTNFLILGLLQGGTHDACLRRWIREGEALMVNVIVWAEFLCGPVTADQAQLASRLFPRPEVLLPEDAERGAELYRAAGRRRGSLADCLIAATCLRLSAAIATDNVADFRCFEPMGLRVVSSA